MAINLINSAHQAAETTFDFSSVFIFLLWFNLSKLLATVYAQVAAVDGEAAPGAGEAAAGGGQPTRR